MADLANLRISVDSRDVKRAATELDQLNRSSTGAEQGATKASSAFRGLGAVLASLGIAAIAREAILMADTFTRMSGQIALVTDNAQQLVAVEKSLFAMSQNTRVGYESTVSLFTRLARSTENLGVSQQSVMRVTETINKAMIVSGTSAEQASGALMQLGQAFASGALRGDELNSVMEGMPRVAQAIAEGMGITVGELRKLGAQGKLTGAEVYAALLKMGEDIDSEFSKMPMTVSQSMTVLSNSLMIFISDIDKATGFTAALAEGIVSLSNNLNQIARVVEVVIVAVAGVTAAFVAFRAALALQAIAAYIGQLIALQFALGATTTASALAGAGIKGLQAILASTGWGLAVVAIGAVVGAIYALVTAQSEAREETQNLINDLGRLAATQDKNYAQAAKRGVAGLRDVQTERNALIERNKQIEAYTAKSGMVGKVAIEYKKNAAAIKEANAFLVQNGNAIIESNKVYNQTEPVLQNVSAAIEKTGKKAKEATDPLEKYRDALAGMVEEGQKIGMTPEQIKAFEVEKLALEALTAGRKKYNKATQENAAQGIADAIRQQGMSNALNQYAADIMEQLSDKLKDYAKSIADANKTHSETIKTLKAEATLLGLAGVEREKAALALEKEAYVLKFGTTAWEEYHAARTANIDAKSVIDKDIEALQTLTSNLETAAGMIGGKVGRSLQGILKLEVTLADGSTKKISEAIAKSFPKLGKTLGAATAGAQVGTSVDQLFKSIGIKSSKMGAQAGGAIGGAAFGPVGAIAGSILGGVLGGMLKKTKTGSATISQIAGQGMQTALSGNSAALKGVANTMATGLLKGLGSVAEQLGGALGGNVKVSLGMRKKDYVVDPTGMGRTKGSGVKNFGEDQAAAVAYVTQLAIQQGIVTGISAGAQTLIRAGNDLNEQVQKALKFDQVFKDLAKESDPLQASLDELSVEMEKLKGIFAEAGASAADYAQLEELYAIKQAKAVFDAARPRREMEIQLMEAQGDAVGALAAQRALELEGIDANLRGLQQQIYAAQDATKAAEALSEAQTKAAEEAAQMAEDAALLARDRRTLEIDLMDALGNSTDALAARRALELEGMDATLRGLQTQIWAANDARVASEAAAEAAKVAAEEQSRALEAVAKLNSDRRELEIQLLEAQGNAVEALAARRAIELEAMDASLVAIKMQIWAAQAKADADAEAAKLAEENLRIAKAALDLAQRRRVLEIDLMDAMGNSTEALAARRAMELEAIDETLRGIQLQIWAAQDATIATQQLADAQEKAAQEAQQIAQAAISLARDRRSLEIELLDALGNSTEALVQRRQMELSSMDETLRGLQTQIWAAQDAREASVAAAEAAKVAAEEQAQQLEFVADLAIRRRELEIELLDAQGMAVEALSARRAMELESMDATLRALKEQIYAAQDKAKADELLAQAAKERAEIETKALEEAAKAAQDYQDALINVTQTIVDEVNRLRGINASSSSALLKAQFATLTAQARTGNLDALGKLPELSRSIEEATLGTATSALEVARIRAWLAASLTETLGAQATTNAELSTSGAGLVFDGNQTGMANSSADTADGIANMRNEMYNVLYQVAKNTGKSYELMDRWDGDGLPDIREDASDYY